jgi:NodT family efflux transporter outer membrane factor (OMF) lipoprotein
MISLFISCSTYSSSINLDEMIENPNGDEWLAENIEFSEQSTIPKDWWNIFKDENLNVIMNEFLDNNYDLKIALLSLQASKSLSIFNKSNLLPDLSLGLGNSIMQVNNKGTQFEDIEISLPNGEIIEFTETDINENHKLNLSSQWEIDLWGKISSNNLSIDKTLKAQQNNFDFLKFSLISQAIKIYFNVVELNEQVNLDNSSVIANQDVFNIVEEKYNKGIGASLLDYRLAKSNLLISQASLEQRKMTLDSYKRQLETLIGRYPAGDILISSSLSNYLPTIPRNLPSNVIQNRPDIVSSYNKIESSELDLYNANRMKYPSFNLTSSIGTSSGELKDILNGDALVWGLGSNILLTIFQNGKLKANEDLAESIYEKSKIEYYNTLLKAFSEIENKLAVSQMLDTQVLLLMEALDEAKKTYELAKDRYNKGLIDLLTVIDSQKRMFNTESQMILSRRVLIENRIDLLICLGGNFSEI